MTESGPCRECGYTGHGPGVPCPACDSRLLRQDTFCHSMMRDAAQSFLAGETSANAFRARLEMQQQIQMLQAEAIVAFIEEVSYAEENGEEVDSGMLGVTLFEEGFQLLYDAPEAEDAAAAVEAGLRCFDEGYKNIVTAMRLNREARERDGGAHGTL